MTSTRTRLGVVGIVLAVLIVATVLIDRHRDEATDRHPPVGDAELHVHGPVPDDADPQTVVAHALTTIFGWRPVSDPAAGAALTRARPWLTDGLARDADSPPATGIRELPQWSGWRASRDVITAATHIEQTAPATDQQCNVSATITQTVVHLDGSTTVFRVLRAVAMVRRTENGWRLASYRLVT
ncbi:hypothetical protein ACQP1G_20460 [Nocardia sp. CA-107356]|uniref:hypothetical protein n=1 Tax=Nocardia sp. CA-107356 TaxID=3239972 RepID=UPI003D8E26FC